MSTPLSGLGILSKTSLLYLESAGIIPTGPQAPPERRPRIWAIGPPSLGDHAGLGGAVELRTPPSRTGTPLLSARYAGTIRDYNRTRLSAARGPWMLQYGYDWRPEERFFGIGSETSGDSLSNYAMQDEYVRGLWRWGWFRSPTAPRVVVSAWGGPRSRVTRTGREHDEISWHLYYPAVAAATLDRRVDHLVYGSLVSTDWRTGKPRWSRGGRVDVGIERYDAPIEALALHSGQPYGAQFTRYSVETELGTSMMRDPRTLRLKVRLADIDVSAGGDRMLTSDMSRLGGRDGLRGFDPGRFHDRDLVVAKLQYIFPLERWIEAEVHAETGDVYANIWNDMRPSALKHSFGFSFRGRSAVSLRGSLGADFSRDGFRFHYAFGDVE